MRQQVIAALAAIAFVALAALLAYWSQGWLLERLMPMVQ